MVASEVVCGHIDICANANEVQRKVVAANHDKLSFELTPPLSQQGFSQPADGLMNSWEFRAVVGSGWSGSSSVYGGYVRGRMRCWKESGTVSSAPKNFSLTTRMRYWLGTGSDNGGGPLPRTRRRLGGYPTKNGLYRDGGNALR